MHLMKLIERIQKIITHLTTDLHEREEIVAVAFLAAISGQNSFLLGPPGTAKSLIARRISCAFKDADYFEYLMNRFSTPEEVFGPVSIKALKDDQYTRKTTGYLPTSDFAFLDEIWKSSPAILNALLTLVNERIFRNGEKIEKAPLKALISASNETPPTNQGLEALYDRFLVRLFVPPMQDRNNFENLLHAKPTDPIVEIDQALKVDGEEWTKWQQDIHSVTLSEEVVTVINLIKNKLASFPDEQAVYVSDRRWQRAAALIKTSAFLCERKTTNLSDALLLRHCLWTTAENRNSVNKAVEDAVQKCGLPTGVDVNDLDKEKEKLDQDIQHEFYYSEDVYDTAKLGDSQYFRIQPSQLEMHYDDGLFYIPVEKMKTPDEFYPIDNQGNEIQRLKCSFSTQGACKISDEYGYRNSDVIYMPTILYHKGDKRLDTHQLTLSAFTAKVSEIQKKYKAALKRVSSHKEKIEHDLDIPFVPIEIREYAYKSIADQVSLLNLRIRDCDRMIELVGEEQKMEKAS